MLLLWILSYLAVLAWHVTTLRGVVMFPNNASIAIPFFGIHALICFLTFDRSPTGLWEPLFKVTPRRVRLARLCLGLAVANFIFYLLLVWGYFLRSKALDELRVLSFLTSLLLVNTLYVALHWAFRPENLFSHTFRQVIANPITYWLFSRK